MSDLLGVKADIKAAGDVGQDLIARVAALEAQSAKDVNAIADKVIAALTPLVKEGVDAVNTLTITSSNAVDQALRLLRRVNGAAITVTLGPE